MIAGRKKTENGLGYKHSKINHNKNPWKFVTLLNMKIYE